MANLEKLTNKIVEEAKIEADRIYKEAEEEKIKLISSMEKKGNKEKELILEKAKREADLRKERVISNAKLKIRNEKLEAKQGMLDKVFEKAVTELNLLDSERKIEFVKRILSEINIAGDEEIILSNDIKEVFEKEHLEDINEKLKSNGKKGELKVCKEDRNLKGGFIITKNGIELNWSFQSIVENLREELECEILEILF
ncbi:V-type ATP synthase subunit E [Oceanirhabdus sp. W0125-5]|uniref:V-type ATP synthase subunit E n=1 Tax=Oceanirhabdus sp. W0125-5 TaxID=2999116 RepID=UPI0022F2B035|nr:V-type ATP synthase subunit E family protein [Oceanirhabdus sp. W0125-5]WBW96018.1 V-type ATP synthase subunit E family protein [Oceanirhabdus sp. W0125-5]